MIVEVTLFVTVYTNKEISYIISQLAGGTITYPTTVERTEIGKDGFYSYWNSLLYFYFSNVSGLKYKGSIDIPAGLGGASISGTGSIFAHWGKITGNGQNPGQVYKSGNNYTIYHYLGNTDYSLILTPISANVPYFSSKSADTVVVTCAGGFDFVLIRTK